MYRLFDASSASLTTQHAGCSTPVVTPESAAAQGRVVLFRPREGWGRGVKE